ncbi:hypothetical protein Hypma_012321 [Hypsizygus marmoreus]|uniref:Uncharacterized protein n=1 Tax=Hypsizygus marmoreus TaxID=39966 RepID=A0A369JH40_HYPMA|nr:hypothetical protein Hypma_012321 [Hypsizygus marmoreus]
MYITSTINPLTRSSSDIPVLLLSFNETRKLVARPKDYADLVQTTLTKFTLPHTSTSTLVFTTSTLDVCRGRDTEIDESAYALIAELLDEVNVTLVQVEDGHGRGEAEVQQVGTSTSTGRRQEKGKATPPPPHATTHISHAIHDTTSTNPPPLDPAHPHPHTTTHISHAIHHTTKDAEQPRTLSLSQPEPTLQHATTHISHGIHHYNTYAGTETEPSSRRGLQEEEEQEEDSNSSSVQPKTQPKAQIKSEDTKPKPNPKPKFRAAQPTTTTTPTPKTLPQYAEIPNPDPTPKPIIRALEEEDAIPSDLDWQFRDQGGNTINSVVEPPTNPSTTRTSPQKTNPKVLGGRQSFAGRTLPMGSASSRSGPQSTSTTTQDDVRFNVMITYEDQAAEFKTRGKHAVKKVLAGACRTFSIDIERARLVLLVDVDGEEHRFACGPEETMAQCGVLPNSKFVIELEEEGEGDVDEGEVYELEEEEFA